MEMENQAAGNVAANNLQRGFRIGNKVDDFPFIIDAIAIGRKCIRDLYFFEHAYKNIVGAGAATQLRNHMQSISGIIHRFCHRRNACSIIE